MSDKHIRLTPEVYAELEQFRDKRESFSEAAGRLLDIAAKVKQLQAALKEVSDGDAN